MLPIWIVFDLGSLDPGNRHANDVESSALANCYVINNSRSQTGTAGIRKDHYHKVKYVPVRRSLLKFWNQASSVTASVFFTVRISTQDIKYTDMRDIIPLKLLHIYLCM